MKRRYRLTLRAKQDLAGIGRYTESTRGKAKRNEYLRRLDQRCAFLAENPKLGRNRSDIRAGYYCFPEGQHLIFYLIAADEIHIIGIPHQSMGIGKFFNS
ncbi:type II toxin-antitoxin system RelE/ParE family toxin [Rhizobium sp. BK602]|uniref:type II toxin-antitoxin system RelE/ParE family toxin n=1 Tax=Rhizobium sp. BK602 TaxID=2586986 RepID=UPI001607B1D2|nr:type II toxin-antitoxin system RelE/ParE family toxin [Rhizobium sp. BK602]MBB3607585.1 toxin ParE1/3/4 [Rhizobium sp. BK602]